MTDRIISDAQIEHFLVRGFVKIEGTLTRELALKWGNRRRADIETDPNDVATWA